MIDLFRTNPFGTLMACLIVLLLALLVFHLGAVFINWFVRAVTWLVPKLDTLALAILSRFG